MQLSYTEHSTILYERNKLRAIDANIAETLGQLAGESVDLENVSESLAQVYSEAVEDNVKELISSFESTYGMRFDKAGLDAIIASGGKNKMSGSTLHYMYAQWYFNSIESFFHQHTEALIAGATLPDIVSLVEAFEEIFSLVALANRIKLYMLTPKMRKKAKYAYLKRSPLPFGGVTSEALSASCRAYFKGLPKSGVDVRERRYNVNPTHLAAARCVEEVQGIIGSATENVSYEKLFEGVEAVRALQRINMNRAATGNTMSKKKTVNEERTIIYLRDKLISVSDEDRFYELYDAPIERYTELGGTVLGELENRIDILKERVSSEINNLK